MTIRTASLVVFSLSILFLIITVVTMIQLNKNDEIREVVEGENHYYLSVLSQLRRVSERATLSIRAYSLSQDSKFSEDYKKAKEDFYISKESKEKFENVWRAFSKMEKIEESALKYIKEGNNLKNATELLFSVDYYQFKYDLIYLVDEAEQSIKMSRTQQLSEIDKTRELLKTVIMILISIIILLNIAHYLFLVQLESKILENSIL
ncbi:hypothetical protein ThvES_00005780 [Thiovulum sp. ES]|nr:hypothetical protein ThvES_00005780 [Thiovulum sp. ES]